MRTKLTDSAIRSYQPRATPYTNGDAACPGLRVRITPKGVKTFVFAVLRRSDCGITIDPMSSASRRLIPIRGASDSPGILESTSK